MPEDYNEENAEFDGCTAQYPYYKNKKVEAYWILYFKEAGKIKFNDITISEWEKAVEYELRPKKNGDKRKSGFRKHNHRPTLYKFICDKEYRNYILNKVYKT
jgi:hypothetical protein